MCTRASPACRRVGSGSWGIWTLCLRRAFLLEDTIRGRLSSTATMIRGRGVEDISAGHRLRPAHCTGIEGAGQSPPTSPWHDFVSDEETSSSYGIHYILKTHADLFGPDDFVVVHDYGVADGSSIEFPRKASCGCASRCLGISCHASPARRKAATRWSPPPI